MTRQNGVSLFQHDDVKINEYWMFRPCWLASSSRRFGRVLPSFSESGRPLTTREVKIIRQCTLVWICVRRGSWPFSVIPFQKLNYFVQKIQLCWLFFCPSITPFLAKRAMFWQLYCMLQLVLSGPYHSHFTGRFTRLQATSCSPKFKFSMRRGSRLLDQCVIVNMTYFPTVFKEVAGKF